MERGHWSLKNTVMRSGTSDLTKKMHDKREVLFEKLRGTELENLEKKQEIIAAIAVLATVKVNAHSQWLAQIEKWKP
jgi:hypothetical protein